MAPGHWLYKRVKRYDVAGHAHFLTFSCNQRLPLFTNDVWREWLGESVRSACDSLRFALWAYVFMPEHLHLLVRPYEEKYEISKFLYLVKKPVAERVLKAMKDARAPVLSKLLVTERGRRAYRFWLPGGGHSVNIWN